MQKTELSQAQKLASWRVQSANLRDKLKVPSDASPWTSTAACRGVPNLPRTRDTLDLAFTSQRKANPNQPTTREITPLIVGGLGRG